MKKIFGDDGDGPNLVRVRGHFVDASHLDEEGRDGVTPLQNAFLHRFVVVSIHDMGGRGDTGVDALHAADGTSTVVGVAMRCVRYRNATRRGTWHPRRV